MVYIITPYPIRSSADKTGEFKIGFFGSYLGSNVSLSSAELYFKIFYHFFVLGIILGDNITCSLNFIGLSGFNPFF